MEDRDISNQIERLETEIVRLREESQLKNGWIALISHNFKGTFSNLISLIEAQEQGSISEADFFNLLPQIKHDAANNLQLINDTAVWRKTQLEGYESQPSEFDVVELYDTLKEGFEEKLSKKNLRFIYHGTESLKIYTDRSLIAFVLERIIDNAIKYSHPGGVVTMTAETDQEGISLTIIDRGIGMNQNQLNSIFTFDAPVYRGTHGETGVGLSLIIARYFVSLMQSEFEIESWEQEGTTVRIKLPHK